MPFSFFLLLLLGLLNGFRAVRDEDDKLNESNSITTAITSVQLKILSFNLEGRGGNQVEAAGQKRRKDLGDYFERFCGQGADAPDVILTQEDVQANINSCYAQVAACEGEEYWFSPDNQFGNATASRTTYLMNKVYVKAALGAKVVKSTEVDLTGAKKTRSKFGAYGFNPRCAAVASLEIPVGKSTERFTFASVHFLGGGPDDETVSGLITLHARVKPWVKDMRSVMLRTVIDAIHRPDDGIALVPQEKQALHKVVIGGDMNGMPAPQVLPCQIWRIDNMLLPTWLEKKADIDVNDAKTTFMDYLTLPETVRSVTISEAPEFHRIHAKVRRGSRLVDEPNDGVEVCTTASMSTSIWGGQPDQFYTNFVGSSSTVLDVGIGTASRAPFPSVLSDHNPVLLTIG